MWYHVGRSLTLTFSPVGQESEVAIDIEGVDLSRAGQVCLIQMCGASMDKALQLVADLLKSMWM